MATMAATKKAEALDELRRHINPGDELVTLVTHVARSGMTRWIRIFRNDPDGGLVDITPQAAAATGRRAYTRGNDGVECGGCGMDMTWDLVYAVSRVLFPDGFECTGYDERPYCTSNDHANRETRTWHPEGGYALRHRNL